MGRKVIIGGKKIKLDFFLYIRNRYKICKIKFNLHCD